MTLPESQPLDAAGVAGRFGDHYLDNLNVGLWVFDIDHSRVVWANRQGLEIWNAESIENLAARDMSVDMSFTVSQRLRQYQEDFEAHDATFTELWTLYPNGMPLTLRVIYRGYRLDDGRMAMLCEAQREIGETPETLRSAEALLHTSVIISLYSDDGKPLYQNPAARALQPDGADNVSARFADPIDFERLMAELDRHGRCRTAARIRTRNGVSWHEITARECRDAVTGNKAFLLSEVDISDLKETEQRVRYLADHDVLTGLPNRNYLQNVVPERIDAARRNGQKITLLLLDLDRFKEINDTLGHAAGDELLIEVARRLETIVEGGGIVSRLGGDEFILIVGEEDTSRDGIHISERVMKLFEQKIPVRNNELHVTPSIGISVFPENGDDLGNLMINADLALYAAKDAGKNRFKFFSRSLQSKMDDRIKLEADLRRALAEKEFELFYQPRINIQSDQIAGAEALLRWHHPERGLLNPQDFITTSEEIGIISEIGEWVITSVAKQQAFLAKMGHPVTLSLNTSPRQFRDHGLIERVQSLTETTGCDPNLIEFEITESMLMDERNAISKCLQTFTDMGFRIAIDDFGTGYSNLAYIQKYPISSLKIDKSFIANLAENGAITQLVISMCKMMGLQSVAEGVEKPEQLEWLRQQGCNEYQGFLFSPAVSQDEFIRLLTANKKDGQDNLVVLKSSAFH